MSTYKIIFDKTRCVGALACTFVAENFWVASEGKVDLVNATYNEKTDKYELIIDEKDLLKNKEAEVACPIDVIKIEKVED